MSGNIDVYLLFLFNGMRGPWIDRIQLMLTDSAPIVAYGAPVLSALWGWIFRRKAALWFALFAIASTLSAAIVVNMLKPLVDRVRPFEVYPSIVKLTGGGGGSFPSGHSGDAFAIAVALCLVFRRWTVVLPALLWAFGVGWSRVALGVHYPSDVLGGIIIGAGSAFLWARVLKQQLIWLVKP